MNGVIGCTECEAGNHLSSKNRLCYGKLSGCGTHYETGKNYDEVICTSCLNTTDWYLRDNACHKKIVGCKKQTELNGAEFCDDCGLGSEFKDGKC